ncbi:hypothetical protein ZIOFF_033267 [Zingiber officinale]|uniref:Uncharacterized protein n=1 Tax=Zingiber officinale TaxID=94328 RepID=A0A8J5GIG0_ZINOF|nr:hypothetical protein ZIOFF_033267 [Zingiber officinale]
MSYINTQATTSYREALQATEGIEAPALGFIRPAEYQGAVKGSVTAIKQANTQIQLLVTILEKLENLEERIKKLEAKAATLASLPDEEELEEKRSYKCFMSKHWEEKIQEWYSKAHTSNFEYLDLAETKPTVKELAHNLAIVYDRLCLSCRAHLKNFKKIHEEIEELKRQNLELRKSLISLTEVVLSQQPLTERQLKKSITNIIEQPKLPEDLNKKT